MGSEYNYDEEGESWPYFVMATLTVILIPLTISYINRVFYSGDADDIALHNASIKGSITESSRSVAVDNLKQISSYKRKKTSDRIFNKTLVILILGWSTAVYIALNFLKEANLTGAFDPYAILEVSPFSSDKEIKSRYRKLSITLHPDKLPRDLSDSARAIKEAEWVRINAAYKSLTDAVTKENFLRYGNPDGPQVITHGIAIPKFFVEGQYSYFVVIGYFVLIGILLPWFVNSWWSHTKSMTKKGLHINTAGLYTRKLTDRNPGKVFTPYDILDWVLASEEVKSGFKHLSPEQVRELVEKHFTRDFSLVKSDPKLEADKVALVDLLPKLIDGFVEIAVVFRQYDVLVAATDLLKAVTQAVRPVGKRQELLQLPFVDAKAVGSSDVNKLGKLMTLSKAEAGKVLGITDSDKLDRALNVAAHIPILRVIEADFKVPGEKTVSPQASTHLSLKFLVKSPKLKGVPEIDEARLQDEDSMEFLRNPLKVNDEQPELPLAYAPYFSNTVQNQWTGFLIAQKENKLVESSSAYQLKNVDLSNLELSQETWKEGGEDVKVGTFKIPLPSPAPKEIGTYNYRLLLKNNTYYGADVDIVLDMDVKAPPPDVANLKRQMMKVKGELPEADSDDESDISDPEDDSLAAAISALRGMSGDKEQATEADDDDDDDDNESVFTDINTDTEDEGEN